MTPTARRRVRPTTLIAIAVALALVITVVIVAVRANGFATTDVESNDGGIWVTKHNASGDGGDSRQLGRLNYQAQQLDAVTAVTDADEFDVTQDGADVFVTSPESGASRVDPATVDIGTSAAATSGLDLSLGDDTVALTSPEGDVWVVAADAVSGFDPEVTKPVLKGLGENTRSAVGKDGTVHVLSGGGELYTVAPSSLKVSDPVSLDVNPGEDVEMAAVGTTPVVLDPAGGTLAIGDATHSLGDFGLSGGGLQLQQSGKDADAVAVAGPTGITMVPLSGSGDATQLPINGSGVPVRPVQAGGQVFGAWQGANVYLRWNVGSEPGTVKNEPIPEAAGDAQFALRENRDLVVLNDVASGDSWMIGENMQIVDNWDQRSDLKQDDTLEVDDPVKTTNVKAIKADRTDENRDPVANPDTFGVRAGQTIQLPAMDNDSDPDGDVLQGSIQEGLSDTRIGQIAAIRDGAAFQIAVDEGAQGQVDIPYSVDDGRGGSAQATMSIVVKGDDENTAPHAAEGRENPTFDLNPGASLSFNILSYVTDDEGDAAYVSGAEVEGGEDQVRFKPSGMFTYQDAGRTAGKKTIRFTISDAKGEVSDQVTARVNVVDDPVEPLATADYKRTPAGVATTIDPMANDINPGKGTMSIAAVQQREEVQSSVNAETGLVTLTADKPGTYYLTYSLNAGTASGQGLIRLDVTGEDQREELAPTAVDDLGVVSVGGRTLIDPLENDVDPSGGLPVLTGVSVPADSGLKATVVNHADIRVEASADIAQDGDPIEIGYTVANQNGESTGTLRIVVAHLSDQMSNPITVNDTATVRAGDVAVIDALDNDESPNESPLTVTRVDDNDNPDPTARIEVADNKVRYTGGETPGNYSFMYEATDDTGRKGSARVDVTVVGDDVKNSAPKPSNLTARTVSGALLRIPVNLSGIDPEGDSTTLDNVASPGPTKGRIVSATGEWIEYEAFEGATGTDTFNYQVVDRKGAVGTAQVQVGLAPAAGSNNAPTAVPDHATVRPGRNIDVIPLLNDSDPEDDPIRLDQDLVSVDDRVDEDSAKAEGDRVVVAGPSEAGTYSYQYRVGDDQLSSIGNISIDVDPTTPLEAPIARDDYVAPGDIIDEDTVTVDVLRNDQDPDGAISDLKLTLDEDATAAGAQVKGEGEGIVVPVVDEAQVLRYSVEDQDGQSGEAVVWVPGRKDQVPRLKPDVDYEVKSGERLEIDLAKDLDVRAGGSTPKIVDPDAVEAGHSDGSDPVVSESVVQFTSEDGFMGDTSITLEVTDGTSVEDEEGHRATITLPITVTAEANTPPTFKGAHVELAQGAPIDPIDLQSAVTDPDEDDTSHNFKIEQDSGVDGVRSRINAQKLDLSAAPGAKLGTTGTVVVSASDGESDPVRAEFTFEIVSSTAQLATLADDVVEAHAGQPVDVDVLKNDSNPFPGEPFTLADQPTVKAGGGTATNNGDQVTVTPAEGYHGVMTVSYSVMDATDDPSRKQEGTIRVTVKDKPDPPSAPRVDEVGDRTATLTFAAGADNGAPIDRYTVKYDGGTQECSATTCKITGLTNDKTYTFTATATNEVGESDPSEVSGEARPDVKPGKPAAATVERGDKELKVSWRAPENHGSPITTYQVQMTDSASGRTTTRDVSGSTTAITWTKLTNGTNYTFSVRALNKMAEEGEPGDYSDASKAEHPAGKPLTMDAPTATRVEDKTGGRVKVTFSRGDSATANGEPITGYVVRASSGEEARADAGDTSASFTGLDENKEVSFSVRATNSVGEGERSAASNAVVPYSVPDAPTGVHAKDADDTDGRATVTWEPAESNGTTITGYVITSGGKSWKADAGAKSKTVDGLSNGTAYRFTVKAVNKHVEGPGKESGESVTPYGNPVAPSIKADAKACNGNECDVVFTWNAPSGNGRKIDHYIVDGKTVTGRSKTVKAKPGENVGVSVVAVNSGGKQSSTAQKNATAKRNEKITLSSGGRASDQPDCVGGNCLYLNIDASGFEPGKTYNVRFVADSKPAGWRSDDDPDDWLPGTTITIDGNGNARLNHIAFWGWDEYTHVEINGVRSNSINGQGKTK